MVFKYINMPKLVAYYLKEFAVRSDGRTTSDLYRFVFCLCLPFVSRTFYRARMIALAIAECTNSADQIKRVLEKVTNARFNITSTMDDYFMAYGSGSDSPDFPYGAGFDRAIVNYENAYNYVTINVQRNGVPRETIESYLALLIPFYIHVSVTYTN